MGAETRCSCVLSLHLYMCVHSLQARLSRWSPHLGTCVQSMQAWLSVLCPHLGTCIQSMQACLSVPCPHLYMCVQIMEAYVSVLYSHLHCCESRGWSPWRQCEPFSFVSFTHGQTDRRAHKANKRKKSTLKPVCLPICVCLWFRLTALLRY